jgi:hypothetical protein
LQAHHSLRKVVVDAFPKAWLAILLSAFSLPRGSIVGRSVLALGVLLAALDVWIDFRSYRREKEQYRSASCPPRSQP